MKKYLIAALALFGLSSAAHADNGTFTVGYSTFAPRGVICSSGVVTQLNATRPTGFKGAVAGYRIQNQDATNATWIGGPAVSTAIASLANLGAKLGAGDSGVWQVGYDADRAALVPLYCRNADADTDGIVVSVEWFGF